MNKVFSLRRVGLLLHRYFLENLNREIMFWCIVTFTFIVLDHRIFVLLVLFVSGLIYSIRLHKDLMKGSNAMHYLLIPANHSEKLVSTIILNTFYHFSMTIIAYSIGNLLVTLTYHFILRMPVPVNWDLFQDTTVIVSNGFIQPVVRNVFWSVLGLFTFSQSLFMLGSLYFKNNAVTKTILSILGFGVVLFLLQLLIFKTLWDVKHLKNAIFPMFVVVSDFTIPNVFKTAFVIGSYLLIPFMWIVSYFRLTEKEA
jgi:hypothetical protein